VGVLGGGGDWIVLKQDPVYLGRKVVDGIARDSRGQNLLAGPINITVTWV